MDCIRSFMGAVVVVIVWQLDLQLHVQSVPITTKVVSSNPVLVEMCSIQQYVIKFVSDLRQVGGFLRVLRFPPPIKHLNDLTEIVLKVTLKTINHKPQTVTKSVNLINDVIMFKTFTAYKNIKRINDCTLQDIRPHLVV